MCKCVIEGRGGRTPIHLPPVGSSPAVSIASTSASSDRRRASRASMTNRWLTGYFPAGFASSCVIGRSIGNPAYVTYPLGSVESSGEVAMTGGCPIPWPAPSRLYGQRRAAPNAGPVVAATATNPGTPDSQDRQQELRERMHPGRLRRLAIWARVEPSFPGGVPFARCHGCDSRTRRAGERRIRRSNALTPTTRIRTPRSP